MITYCQVMAHVVVGLIFALGSSSCVRSTTTGMTSNQTMLPGEWVSTMLSSEISSSILTMTESDYQRNESTSQSGSAADIASTVECLDHDDDKVTSMTRETQKIPLYIGGFFAMGKNNNWDGSGILPAVEMALEHVNDRPGLLDDYELRMEWVNSEVHFQVHCFNQ